MALRAVLDFRTVSERPAVSKRLSSGIRDAAEASLDWIALKPQTTEQILMDLPALRASTPLAPRARRVRLRGLSPPRAARLREPARLRERLRSRASERCGSCAAACAEPASERHSFQRGEAVIFHASLRTEAVHAHVAAFGAVG